LRRARLGAQLLHQPRRRSAADVVRHLTGVQAQMLAAAELGLHVRSVGLTRARIDRARLRDRSIVRTWAMRGTLHLIAADDHGWLVPLLAEPGLANARRRLAQEKVSASQADRAVPLIGQMLADHGPMTRPEIAARLARRRIPVQGQAIAHLVWMAAATGAIVYGPDRDGDPCYVSTRDWLGAPHPARDRDDALRELAIRYLRAHGPAAPQDLAAWSGLGARDAERAWSSIADRLIPFPEYLLGWRDRSFALAPKRARSVNRGGGMIRPVLIVDGRVEATWRTVEQRPQLEPFGRLTPSTRRRVAAESTGVERFLSQEAN
jgi:hypothetical protein